MPRAFLLCHDSARDKWLHESRAADCHCSKLLPVLVSRSMARCDCLNDCGKGYVWCQSRQAEAQIPVNEAQTGIQKSLSQEAGAAGGQTIEEGEGPALEPLRDQPCYTVVALVAEKIEKDQANERGAAGHYSPDYDRVGETIKHWEKVA